MYHNSLSILPLMNSGLFPVQDYYKSLVSCARISAVCPPGMEPIGQCAFSTSVSAAKLLSEVDVQSDTPISCVCNFPLLPNLQKQKWNK